MYRRLLSINSKVKILPKRCLYTPINIDNFDINRSLIEFLYLFSITSILWGIESHGIKKQINLKLDNYIFQLYTKCIDSNNEVSKCLEFKKYMSGIFYDNKTDNTSFSINFN